MFVVEKAGRAAQRQQGVVWLAYNRSPKISKSFSLLLLLAYETADSENRYFYSAMERLCVLDYLLQTFLRDR